MKSEKTKQNIKNNTTRIVLNVPNELNNSYELMASKRGITKTSMVVYAMSWFLDYNKSIELVPKLMMSFRSDESENLI